MYRIGCVLMAAGNAKRFNSNKLLADFNSKTLYERALEVIPKELFYRVAVVTQFDELLGPARELGFDTVKNELPEAGLSYTIGLGIAHLQDADAIMFLVADQPLLRKQSIVNIIKLHRANPESIVSLAFGERRGNPCVFPREFFPELFALSGDTGGSAVIDRHADRLLLCYSQDGRELNDVDTVDELRDLIR